MIEIKTTYPGYSISRFVKETTNMRWEFNDGGRAEAGYRGDAGDCVVRAIAIASQTDYQTIYDLVNSEAQFQRKNKKGRTARSGVLNHRSIRRLLDKAGWTWTPTMQIGQGCTTHLRDGELPMGRLIVNVSKHLVAVIDGVIQDTHDCSREGTRCVYGYWSRT